MVETIIDRITIMDDGGLDIIKKAIKEVIGECSEATFQYYMTEVLYRLS